MLRREENNYWSGTGTNRDFWESIVLEKYNKPYHTSLILYPVSCHWTGQIVRMGAIRQTNGTARLRGEMANLPGSAAKERELP